jgi:hypothetical protein
VSQRGVFVWAAAAPSCVLGAVAIWDRPHDRQLSWYLVAASLITLMLGFDDAFQLHERFAPLYLGVDDIIVLGTYVNLIIIFVVRFFRVIVGTDYVLLVMAFGFFGLSIIVDVMNFPSTARHLFEDGPKFVGIATWMTYFFKTALLAIRRDAAAAPEAEPVPVPDAEPALG